MFNRCLRFSTIFFLFIFSNSLFATEKTIWVGVVVLNNDATIRDFFSKIDSLDYDKSMIHVQLDILSDSSETIEFVKSWCHVNALNYEGISYDLHRMQASQLSDYENENMRQTVAKFKDLYLEECRDFDYLFILTSDVFLHPCTLKHLVDKQVPVITPLVRALPQPNDPFSNFYCSSTRDGYYTFSPKDWAIAFRHDIGTFRVACTQMAYLIDTKYVDKLTFNDGLSGWDFISFSRTARQNEIPIHLCNEREFGCFIHLPVAASLYDERSLVLPMLQKRLTHIDFKRIINPYIVHDQTLKEYIDDSFSLHHHAIYGVEDDFFCVDEKYDYIKNCFIKRGLHWEPHIKELLKKYVVPGSRAIDLGGHIGSHTISLSKYVGEEGEVHVFEPQVKIFTELLLNLDLNKCKNVVPHRLAIGSEEGTVEMTHPYDSNEGMGRVGKGGELAPMKTLDSYNFENVSVIKIDIEGYEMEALKGAQETLKRNRPVMIVEVLTECEWRLRQIRAMGYEVIHISQDDYLCLPK